VAELQALLDRFVAYYNNVRPHRALGRRIPAAAYGARVKARPSRDPVDVEGYRIRHDRVDDAGKVTLRYAGSLFHIGVGRAHKRTRVILLVAGKEVRILDDKHRLIRAFTLDPTRPYQPQN
jgi:Integrase core domain